jgi:hypothetical protein
MFVKPATRPAIDDDGTPIEGAAPVPLLVRHPSPPFYRLRETGERVPDTDHWRRLLRDGDVVETDPPEPETPADGDAR